jgi:hypothetical protein
MKLARKLGIKHVMKVMIRGALGFRFTSLELVRWDQAVKGASDNRVDCVIAFVRCKADVQAVAPTVLSAQ